MAPGKSRGLAAALADGEIEAGLDRRDGVVEVVAIERQAGLEAQAVAGAQADRLDPSVGQKSVPQFERHGRREQRISKPSSPV